MSDMKTKAGITTALTGVGTVGGGVALGAGVMKSSTDKELTDWQNKLKQLQEIQAKQNKKFREITTGPELLQYCMANEAKELQFQKEQTDKDISAAQTNIDKLDSKSKTLGYVRTGGLAATALTDTAGAIMSAGNRVKDDLKTRIDDCIAATKKLSNAYDAARAEPDVDSDTLMRADKIIQACREWEYVDMSKINKKATGATVTGGAGALMALVGTATSVSANSSKVRNDDSDAGKNKEKNLNTASNILAGGAGVASLTSVVFNASQKSAIKKAASAAEKCEEALR